MKKLNLNHNNPLVFINIISNDEKDVQKARIKQLSCIKYEQDKNPVKIVRNFELEGKNTFEEKSKNIFEFFKGCDFVGYDIASFQIPLLIEEFSRCGIEMYIFKHGIIDLHEMHVKFAPINLQTAIQSYKPAEETNEDLIEDVVDVFKSMMMNHGVEHDLKVDELKEHFNPKKNALDSHGKIILKNGVPTLNMGKFKDQPVVETMEEHPDYFKWVTTSFDAVQRNTIAMIKQIVAKSKVQKEQR